MPKSLCVPASQLGSGTTGEAALGPPPSPTAVPPPPPGSCGQLLSALALSLTRPPGAGTPTRALGCPGSPRVSWRHPPIPSHHGAPLPFHAGAAWGLALGKKPEEKGDRRSEREETVTAPAPAAASGGASVPQEGAIARWDKDQSKGPRAKLGRSEALGSCWAQAEPDVLTHHRRREGTCGSTQGQSLGPAAVLEHPPLGRAPHG